jgi:uncharacterized protein involved in exopolysaccharide biosynthesis
MIEQEISTNQAVAELDVISSPDASSENIEVSLIDVLTQLAYRKWLIAKVTGVAMLIGLILCFVLPVKYTATTKIMTPQQSSSATALMSQLSASGAGSLAALAGGGLSALKDPNTLYVGLLNSRPVADAIIKKFNLNTVYRTKNMTDARKKLAENTVVTSEKTGFISVSVTDKDKKRVAEMANAFPDQLRSLTKTLAITEASQRRLFYEEQMNQAKDALLSAELAFQQVQQKKGLVQPEAQAKAVIESIAALHAKVAAKEVEVTALRSYSTERSPEVQMAESQLASLQAETAKFEQQSHSSDFGDIGLADVPGAGMEYLRADHEVRYQQALYDLLMKQYDAAGLDEAKQPVVIQVVETAIEPDRRTSPKLAIVMIQSTAIGVFLGCFSALALWWIKNMEFDSNATKKFGELRNALAWRSQRRQPSEGQSM